MLQLKGRRTVVKLLLDRGADVNAKTATGITPLIAAASVGDADIVKLLLEKGTDVSVERSSRAAPRWIWL